MNIPAISMCSKRSILQSSTDYLATAHISNCHHGTRTTSRAWASSNIWKFIRPTCMHSQTPSVQSLFLSLQKHFNDNSNRSSLMTKTSRQTPLATDWTRRGISFDYFLLHHILARSPIDLRSHSFKQTDGGSGRAEENIFKPLRSSTAGRKTSDF